MKWLVVTKLAMSGDVDNVYVVEAKTENEAYSKTVDYGFVAVIKEIRDDNLPLIAFKTIDIPKILREKK